MNLRYLKDAEIYLEEDIRMDMEAFQQMDSSIFNEYIKMGKKADSIKFEWAKCQNELWSSKKELIEIPKR